MAAPTVSDLRAWMGKADSINDSDPTVVNVLPVALAGAIAYVETHYDLVSGDYDDGLTLGTLMLAARWVGRASSANGIVGFDDYGVVRITRNDTDISMILDPYRKMVFA